jgi:hypothetical protein
MSNLQKLNKVFQTGKIFALKTTYKNIVTMHANKCNENTITLFCGKIVHS